MYKQIIRPILFQLDPEFVHETSLRCIRWAKPVRSLVQSMLQYADERLQQTIWDIPFANPFGLAGGFDKNARCADLWPMFGFSFVELGTITPNPQEGNPRPRLFRYPGQKAIINRMGFNNDGADAIANRLSKLTSQPSSQRPVLGISLGKQKETPADDLIAVAGDYLKVLHGLYEFGDYFAVNVSSPNTKDLRSLQEKESLKYLLSKLIDALHELAQTNNRQKRKPICVKLAPDLSNSQILDALEVVLELGVDGIIATNTTNQTQGLEQGGLSGVPLRERSTEVIRIIAHESNGTLPIIGCGGVFTVEDALEKLLAGACLVQVYTGFVYEGPFMVRNLCKGLCDEMNAHGYSNLSSIRAQQPDGSAS